MAGNLERGAGLDERTALLEQSETLECSRCQEGIGSRKVTGAGRAVTKHTSGGGENPSTELAGRP